MATRAERYQVSEIAFCLPAVTVTLCSFVWPCDVATTLCLPGGSFAKKSGPASSASTIALPLASRMRMKQTLVAKLKRALDLGGYGRLDDVYAPVA